MGMVSDVVKVNEDTGKTEGADAIRIARPESVAGYRKAPD
jgi:hypothetical protein